MSWPDAAALIHYARLMNGTCPDCGCILPHRDSLVAAMSKRAEASEARAAKLEAAVFAARCEINWAIGYVGTIPEDEWSVGLAEGLGRAAALLVSAGRDEQVSDAERVAAMLRTTRPAGRDEQEGTE